MAKAKAKRVTKRRSLKSRTAGRKSAARRAAGRKTATKSRVGKASKMEIETALNDIVGAMSQEEVTKAAQQVKQYDDQHKIAQ